VWELTFDVLIVLAVGGNMMRRIEVYQNPFPI